MSLLGRRPSAIILLGLLVALAAALPAHAHERLVAPVVSSETEAVRPVAETTGPAGFGGEQLVIGAGGADSSGAVVLLVAIALTLLVAVRVPWRRRVVAVLLVAVLAGVAFETGVHSVHHLGDPKGAGHCAVAASADHVVPVVAAACDVAPTEVHSASDLDRPASTPASGDYRPDAGRAPPSSAS
jgi:hypothetical protein